MLPNIMEFRSFGQLLQPDAITGMGDNLNDIPLFEACDRCCAVGNAHKEVKERAEYVLRYESECWSGEISGRRDDVLKAAGYFHIEVR